MQPSEQSVRTIWETTLNELETLRIEAKGLRRQAVQLHEQANLVEDLVHVAIRNLDFWSEVALGEVPTYLFADASAEQASAGGNH